MMYCIPTKFIGVLRIQALFIQRINKETKTYKPNHLKAMKIAKGVFLSMGLSISDLAKRSRKKEIIEAKRIAIYLISDNCIMKDEDIAQLFAIHRTSVISNRRVYEDLFFSDKKFKKKVETIRDELSLN